MRIKHNDYGAGFFIHSVIYLVAFLSPLLFHWQIITSGALLLQFLFLGNCVLTFFEFGSKTNKVFIGYHLEKWRLVKKYTKRMDVFVTYILPIIIIGIAIILQVGLNIIPPVNYELINIGN